MKVDVHADDYGLSVDNSRTMIELIREGKLDSISIICVMDCFDECMDMLKEAWDSFEKKPLITVHIDLVDGISCTDAYRLMSWGGLFKVSLLGGSKRRELRSVLAEEIKSQIVKVTESLPAGTELRLDSHMHTHMIPVVADAMWDAVDSLGASVSFVRVAREPIAPFISEVKLWTSYSPVNFAKNFILNFYSGRMERECDKRGIEHGLLWGLIMSGGMDRRRVGVLWDKMCGYAKRKDAYLEVLFHPGIITPEEVVRCHNVPDICKFYVAEGRNIELDAVKGLRG